MKKTFLILSIVSLLLILAGGGYLYHLITIPGNSEIKKDIIKIDPGQSFKATASRLYSGDMIRNEHVFYLLGRLTGQAREIKAGHFEVDPAWNMIQMLEHLTTGREALIRLRIPEGLTWWQIASILENKGLADFDEFKQLAHDQDFLTGHSIHASSAEGFLYPETYYLSPTRDKGARRLLSIMINQFWNTTGELWKDMDFDDIYQAVNLASLIEKETGISGERKTISGVFHNRIGKNMRLQCDPTIIYGLKEDFDGIIRRSHLDNRDNLYNTYKHMGFPPTPICSPGLASMEAALYPEKHDYLYFVSKNDGSHHFSKSLREHNRAVNKYQRR
ncbi:MAG: endolytic transglycosylase MltG [Desulfonatronovibrio sp.]